MPSGNASNVQEYVCGFLFTPDRSKVLLIRKRRPAWQAGKLNGLGGKIEPGETRLDAMRREFREEAGIDVPQWQHVLTLSGTDDAGSGRGWAGHFFRAFGDVETARPITDEQLEIHPTTNIPPDTIPNLRWMIPLMLDEEPVSGSYAVRMISHASND
jgi:8-oxo-dGTP diphosphatase